MTSAINLRNVFVTMLSALVLLVYGLMVPAAVNADADGDAPAPPITSIGKIDVKYTAPPVKTEADDILAQLGLAPEKKEDGKSITGWCTGWVVDIHDDTAYIMTAGHCTDTVKAAKGLGVENPDDVRMDITFTRADNVNGENAPNPRKAQFLGAMESENGDLSLLRIHKFKNEVLTPLPIAPNPASTGDNISATGFPKQPDEINVVPNLLTTWGRVTSDVASTEMNSMFYMTVQAPFGGGMSGGPVMSEDGVVGVISRGVPKSDLFQYAVDQETIQRFLRDKGIAMNQETTPVQGKFKPKSMPAKPKLHQAQAPQAGESVVLNRGFDTERISGWGEAYWQAQVDAYNWGKDRAVSVLAILGGVICIVAGIIALKRASSGSSGGRHRKQ